MSTKPAIAPVIKKVKVDCTPAEAFVYFTDHIDKWWPLATHSVVAFASDHTQTAVSCGFEPRVGGRVWERAANGEEHMWGTVLAWEPPTLVSFTWHPMRDPAIGQTVEVRFNAVAQGTEVVLTHGGWEVLGEAAQQERDGYENGWESVFVASFPAFVQKERS